MSKPTLEDILAVYNSIHPSRRRWYGNTNKLRNNWKELYEILEQASGRSGGKPVVFDENWHEVVDGGNGVRTTVNKEIVHEVAEVVEEAKTREAVIETAKVIEAVTEAPTAPQKIEVEDQDVGTKVQVHHLPIVKVAGDQAFVGTLPDGEKVVAKPAKKPTKKKKAVVKK